MYESTSGTAGCPVAPQSRATVYARTLHRACLIVGGVPELAEHLRVSPVSLVVWMEGREPPPLGVFLAAVDIVLLHAEQAGNAG